MSEQVIPAIFFEDELDLKEEEILSAACRLIKKFRHLDRETGGNVTGRLFGILDRNVFIAACSENRESEVEELDRTLERATESHLLWSNVVDASYLLVEPGEIDLPFKPYSVDALERLKHELGLVLYRHVRKAFREVRVSVKYSMQLKPWDFSEGKEASLDYILTALEQSRLQHSNNNNNLLLHMDRDFNGDDFELLLALDENHHQHRGASTSLINNLPESIVQTDNFQETCVICLETQTIGDTIRHLPCFHKFHKDCIDTWLRLSRACPVCKEEVY